MLSNIFSSPSIASDADGVGGASAYLDHDLWTRGNGLFRSLPFHRLHLGEFVVI